MTKVKIINTKLDLKVLIRTGTDTQINLGGWLKNDLHCSSHYL